jgi:hypothetical protein
VNITREIEIVKFDLRDSRKNIVPKIFKTHYNAEKKLLVYY